jgi:hypothetical protein
MTPSYGTAQLDLAATWAHDLELSVEPLEVRNALGAVVPAIGIVRGQVRFALFEVRNVLHLVCSIQVPEEVRSATSRLKATLQEEMLIALRQAISECPRVGWVMLPMTTAKIGDLKELRLDETFRISESELQSFNRFADALQELSTVVLKASGVYGQLMTTQSSLPGAWPKTDSPPSGYA